jgi:hypothetical protein
MITLAKAYTAFGEITILQSQTNGSHIYWQGEWLQSEADCKSVNDWRPQDASCSTCFCSMART